MLHKRSGLLLSLPQCFDGVLFKIRSSLAVSSILIAIEGMVQLTIIIKLKMEEELAWRTMQNSLEDQLLLP